MKKFLLATMALVLILCFPLNSQAKTKSVKNTTSVSLKTSHTKLNITNHFTKALSQQTVAFLTFRPSRSAGCGV